MEFYAATSLRLIIANASGEKRGAIGRPLPGCAPIAVMKLSDVAAGVGTARAADPARPLAVRAGHEEPGLLLVGLDAEEEAARRASGLAVLLDVFALGDRWAPTNDVVRVDRDGDLWFVDVLAGLLGVPDRAADGGHSAGPADARPGGLRVIESLLLEDPAVELAVAFRDERGGGLRLGAAVRLKNGASPASFEVRLRGSSVALELDYVRVADVLPMSEGFRVGAPALAALSDTARPGERVIVLQAPASPGPPRFSGASFSET